MYITSTSRPLAGTGTSDNSDTSVSSTQSGMHDWNISMASWRSLDMAADPKRIGCAGVCCVGGEAFGTSVFCCAHITVSVRVP